MLKLAIKARIPLVWVTTDDTVNIGAVLEEIAGEAVTEGQLHQPSKIAYDGVSYVFGSEQNWDLLYTLFSERKSTLIIVGGKTHTAFYEAGFVTAPVSMIRKFVAKYASADVEKIVNALSGLSFKQAVEVSKLAMTDEGVYSARAIQNVRRIFFGSTRGLEPVNTRVPMYQPNVQLTNWLDAEGPFIFGGCHPILRPRGILFGGDPGTGKTMGAKYVAEQLDQPLYRLDIGIVMSKWAGESEKNLRNALRQAENCAPCILLIDEVEKLFGNDDAGVSTRLLASLLWWLQEHQNRVFMIMTTNKQGVIPPELIRPGRIDRQMNFPILYIQDGGVHDFVVHLLHELQPVGTLTTEISHSLKKRLIEFGDMSHAQATTMVLSALKASILDKANPKG